MDTVRRLQDHDLTLFPQSAIRFFLGYSRDTQSGPALSTIQLFNSPGDEYPLFTNINSQQNEYRLGGEVRVLGFRLNVLHGWEDFKEDTQQILEALPSWASIPTACTSAQFLPGTAALPRHQPLLARGTVSRRQEILGGERAFHLRGGKPRLRPERVCERTQQYRREYLPAGRTPTGTPNGPPPPATSPSACSPRLHHVHQSDLGLQHPHVRRFVL